MTAATYTFWNSKVEIRDYSVKILVEMHIML